MKEALLISFALFVTVTLAGAAEAWTEFTPKDNSFSILFPGEPVQTTQTQKTAIGATQVTTYGLELKEGGTAHSAVGVSISEYPVGSVGEEHTQILLESARNGAMKTFGGQLRGERDLELNGLKGKEVILESPGTVARMRYFWISPRLYQLNVITTPEMENILSKDFDNFFSSFKINQN